MAKNRIELTAPNLFLGPTGSGGGPEAIDAILAERRAKALERSAQMFRVAELERETRRFAEQRTRQIIGAVSRTFEILNNAAHRVSPAYQEATRAHERMVERISEAVIGSGAIRAGVSRLSEAAEGWAAALVSGARENGHTARGVRAAGRGLHYYFDSLPAVLALPLKGMAILVLGIAEMVDGIAPVIANLPGADFSGATKDTEAKRNADRAQAAARVAKWNAGMAEMREWLRPTVYGSTEDVAAIIAEIEASQRRTRGEGTVSRGLVDAAGVPVPLGNYRTLMDALLGRYVAALVDQLDGWTKSRAVQGIAAGVERILRDGSASLSAMAGQTHALIASAVEQLRLTGSRLLPVAESAEGLAGAFEAAARVSESVAASGGSFARFAARARLVYAAALASFNGALYAAKAATSFALFDYYRGALYATASGFFFASAALALGGAAGIVRGSRPGADESLSDAVALRGRDLTLTVNGDVVTEDDEWLATHVLEPIASGGYVVPEFAVVRGTGASRASDADQVRAFIRGLIPFRRKKRSKNPFKRAAESIANNFGSQGFFGSFLG